MQCNVSVSHVKVGKRNHAQDLSDYIFLFPGHIVGSGFSTIFFFFLYSFAIVVIMRTRSENQKRSAFPPATMLGVWACRWQQLETFNHRWNIFVLSSFLCTIRQTDGERRRVRAGSLSVGNAIYIVAITNRRMSCCHVVFIRFFSAAAVLCGIRLVCAMCTVTYIQSADAWLCVVRAWCLLHIRRSAMFGHYFLSQAASASARSHAELAKNDGIKRN